MSKALSLDLRVRVLASVHALATQREAAERFGVSAASVSRWRTRQREQADARPKALGGDRRSGRIEARRDAIMAALGPDRDATIEEVRRDLVAPGLSFGSARSSASSLDTTSRAKKTAHASEQDRPDVSQRHEAWFEGLLDLDPSA
jgi:transposase